MRRLTRMIFQVLAICTFLTGMSANVWAKEKRVALVIGNSGYKAVASLVNPVNDAKDLAEALTAIGFEVQIEMDLAQQEMLQALKSYKRRSSDADIALIYYAGHGIEIEKQNYLIPVDAELQTVPDVSFETIPLETAVIAAEGAKKLSLIILDACRNNPFINNIQSTSANRSIGRGLAVIEPVGNTLIAYAARGGTTAADGEGRNSPYAKALIEALSEPEVEIGLLFRRVRDNVWRQTNGQQEPFVYGSLSANKLYLNDLPKPVEVPVKPEPAPLAKLDSGNQQGFQEEVVLWSFVSNSSDVNDLQDFIASYPNSVFLPMALRRLDRLKATNIQSAPSQTPLRTSNTDPVSSSIDERTSVQKPEIQSQIATLDKTETKTNPSTSPQITETSAQQPRVIDNENSRSLTRNEIRELQERLTILELKPGPIDGLLGRKTTDAIIRFQIKKNVPQTGKADQKILNLARAAVSDEDVEILRARLAQLRAEREKRQARARAEARAQAQAKAKADAAVPVVKPAEEKVKKKRWWEERALADDDDDDGGGGSSCSGLDC